MRRKQMRMFKAFILAVLLIAISAGVAVIFYCMPAVWRWVVIGALFIWMVFRLKNDLFSNGEE